jgi:hypothetical protein
MLCSSQNLLNIAATDREGWVPLQLAQFRDNVDVEHLLLDNSAKQGSWDDELWRSVKANAKQTADSRRACSTHKVNNQNTRNNVYRCSSQNLLSLCTVCTCLVRPPAVQWVHAWSLRFSCTSVGTRGLCAARVPCARASSACSPPRTQRRTVGTRGLCAARDTFDADHFHTVLCTPAPGASRGGGAAAAAAGPPPPPPPPP